ncbi:hypothetical protein CHISP_2278 [Chitinispirillum alkaliphilum]|nr:hypothetical protein CHISP_2278 [Chitinispirillum alkaliphilum]
MKKVFHYTKFILLTIFIIGTVFSLYYKDVFYSSVGWVVVGVMLLSIFLTSPIWSNILRTNFREKLSARILRYSIEISFHSTIILIWSIPVMWDNDLYIVARYNMFPLGESFHQNVERMIQDRNANGIIERLRNIKNPSRIPFERYSATAFSAARKLDDENFSRTGFFYGIHSVWPSDHAVLAHLKKMDSPDTYDSLWGKHLSKDEFASIAKHYLQPHLNLKQKHRDVLMEAMLNVCPQDSFSVAIRKKT